MIPELTEHAASIRTRLEQLADAVRTMTPAQLNYRPAFDGANSAWVLATHTAGNARAWALGIACGIEMRRDRPAEFASAGDDGAALAAELLRTADEIDAALAKLDPARLDVRLTPSKELWGENEPHEITVRRALVQIIEHASMHLGHLHVTRDLAAGQG